MGPGRGPDAVIPSTWETDGAGGNGDGVADPQNIDDGGPAAGRNLCASSTMSTPPTWRATIQWYDNADLHIDAIAAAANGSASITVASHEAY